METEIQKMHQVWDKYQMAKERTDLPHIKFDDLINSIFTVGPTYYIIDFFDMKISHMSASVKDINGVNPETATFDDI